MTIQRFILPENRQVRQVYCTYCGSKLEETQVPRYDPFTGEQDKEDLTLTCPNFAQIDDRYAQHDSRSYFNIDAS
jgi:hypothetical protein